MAEATTTTNETELKRNFRKVRVGIVVSDKMDKTVVVEVADLKSHPLYKKVLKIRVRFKAHDEKNECGTGDKVRIAETRPISKQKRWRVVEIVEKAR
jgi:small subunit ribosomal protein S17